MAGSCERGNESSGSTTPEDEELRVFERLPKGCLL
jgi:hypothetical protein